MSIRLVALDVDGVVGEGNGRPIQLGVLAELARLNERPEGPRITLLTGRPAPFVEVLAALIGARAPAVYESGCGLWQPQPYAFLRHPELPPPERIEEARRRLWEGVVAPGLGFFQPGKEHSFTLFAARGRALEELEAAVGPALGELAGEFTAFPSIDCLNLLPRGVDKGQGLRWLCRLVGVELEQVLAVGDSEVDLPFLEAAGRCAAPANASPAVRSAVDFLAPGPAAEGLLQILDHFGLR